MPSLMPLCSDDTLELERMIDATSVEAVLFALATVCAEKSDHIATNWQDMTLAKSWDKVQHIIRVASVDVHAQERDR